MTAELELAFVKHINAAISKMIGIKYKPLKLMEMVITNGTVETVKELMRKKTTPSGFKRLADMGCETYSLEYIVATEPQWKEIFGNEYGQCKTNAEKRLSEYDIQAEIKK